MTSAQVEAGASILLKATPNLPGAAVASIPRFSFIAIYRYLAKDGC